MRAYSIATTALALNLPRKRLENMLTRYALPGTHPGRQGRARRLPFATVLAVRLAVMLQEALGLPVQAAVKLATELLASSAADGAVPTRGSVALGPLIVAVELGALEQMVASGLNEAVEIAPRRRRGRPRSRARTRRPL